MEILVKRLHEQAALPKYSREAGPEIALTAVEEVRIESGERKLVRTGIAMALPIGYAGLVVNQQQIIVSESIRITPMTINSGYRGEILIELYNHGEASCTLLSGATVAQLLIQKIEHAQLIEAEDLSSSH